MKCLFLISFLFAPSFASAATFTIPAPENNRDAATVFVPDALSRKSSWPLILLLHGYSGSGNKINNHFGLSQEVNSRGFVLVLPNGRKSSFGPRYWNATDACCDFEHSRSDDVKYLTDLLREVALRVPIDSRKIYAAGHSNGAFMVHRLACDTKGIFAAMASFAGVTFNNPADCIRDEQISLLQIHAVNDNTIKFSGDERGLPSMAPYPGSEVTVNRWMLRNECNPLPETRGTLDLVRSIPSADTSVLVWNGCANSSQTALWKIRAHTGQGHNAHTPALTKDFRDALLSFLLEKSRP